ncbi:MAG: LysE family translocator, partial [Rhizobiaceae bacterium]
VALGDLIAMTASLAGLGALVLASAQLFILLKWAGAIYLIYLGIKLFRSAPTARLDSGDGSGDGGGEDLLATPSKGVFGHAAAVTALNPKSIVFFIAFVPQFITPDQPLTPQFVILIATFVGMAAINALAYALLADRLRRKISKPSVLGWLTRFGGAALVSMGIATAAIRRVNA